MREQSWARVYYERLMNWMHNSFHAATSHEYILHKAFSLSEMEKSGMPPPQMDWFNQRARADDKDPARTIAALSPIMRVSERESGYI